MSTDLINKDSNQLFASAVVTTDSASFAFRSCDTRDEFNKLSTWIKGRLGTASIVLQTLKPAIKIGADTEADWTTTQDVINVPDEFRTEYLQGYQRYKVFGVGADSAITSASQNSGVEVNYEITAHGLEVGDKIVTNGFTPSAYDGTFTVKAVVDINNVTVDLLSDPGGNATVVGTMASTVLEPYLRKNVN